MIQEYEVNIDNSEDVKQGRLPWEESLIAEQTGRTRVRRLPIPSLS